MMNRNIMRNLEDFENPRIVRLDANFYGASFFLMKLLPARFILEQAVSEGLLKPGATICESSSGTFGLALAMLAVQYGYKLILVSDWAIDRHLKSRLVELGAHVEVVNDPAPQGGLQQARLNRLAKYLKEIPGSFWPSQYSNTGNPLAYGKFAELLIQKLVKVDCLVGPVGSGGSMSGTTRFLRVPFPELHAIGVDMPHSVLFGQPCGDLGDLSGLGGEIVPSNVDHRQFDEVHWLTPAEVFHATHQLHREHGLFMGPTSGAAYRVADWWSRKNPGKNVVAIFPDEGHRYVDTIYNYEGDWLSSLSITSSYVREAPVTVEAPTEVLSGWSCYAWGRRTLDEVLSRVIEEERPELVSRQQKLEVSQAVASASEQSFCTAPTSHIVAGDARLLELSCLDSATVAHLRLDADQCQYVDPLYVVFSELRQSQNSEFEHCFSVVAHDDVVGFFVLREKAAVPEWANPDAMTMHSLRVGLSYQGKGYGKAAAELAIGWIASNRPNVDRLMLAVNARNVVAKRMYLGFGFRDTGLTYCGPIGIQNIFEYEITPEK
ncbi:MULTISPECIES: pyridoxal-phosphate dependent enzyme [Paraburkholderia]|uniref:pyridoxal-phosphate dependent enzyme n=1 Tax=Paraburkholderia TaxID=1822464 RepID=UPI0009F3D98C|nr:pyridoxal-phosphate dependent enzyme [Paraburkholderia nodosa]